MSEAVLLDVADGVATITLNRPEAMNAINGELAAGLLAAYREVRRRDDIRVALLTGNGRAFCAGADLKARVASDNAGSPIAPLFRTEDPEGVYDYDPRKPVIAAINGYCLGGGFEIALTADILVAADNATFGLPEITLGFFPGGGGPVRLPRSIPRALANDMLLTGERIDARAALERGIISRVFPADELLPAARAMALRIAGNAPLAVRAMRELIRRQEDLPHGDAMRLAGSLRWIIGLTDDAKEGPRAFAEKRTASFKGQ
ncbi:MAG: enoyl-CoA hydratase/isomerase family protein [Dehalococcoidia bacterium]|nr:enoyl-CoA hydratase/isomerase family protein [Dehalococcoidia bacterium]